MTAAHRESDTRTERIFLAAIRDHLVNHDRAGAIARTSPADIASGIREQAQQEQADHDRHSAASAHELRIHLHHSPRNAARYEGSDARMFTMTASINSGSCAWAASTRFRPASSIPSLISIRTAFIAPIYFLPFTS